MNEVINAINSRYSCRDFSPEPLTGEEVKTLVESALAAPSAMNRMPWHILAVTDKQLIEEMDDEAMAILEAREDKTSFNRMKERGGRIFYNAPCMIFILSDDTEYAAVDCGIATQNVALAAHGLGLGNVICAMAQIPLNGGKGEGFKKRLQFPEGYKFGMAVCVGQANSGKHPHPWDRSKVTYVEG